MSRRNFTPRTKAAMFLRANGRCEGMVNESGRYAGARGDTDKGWRRCGAKIGDGVRWTADHIVPDALGGLNDAENGQCLCPQCDAEKTGKRDAKHIAKSKRMTQRRAGIGRTVKKPLPGSRASGWKKCINGTWVRRG